MAERRQIPEINVGPTNDIYGMQIAVGEIAQRTNEIIHAYNDEVAEGGFLERVVWDEVGGKPTEFNPAAHRHTLADIEDYTPYEPGAVEWQYIEGKPATFTPSAHRHGWADLDGIPTEFTPAAHVHGWAEITDKPATFPPEAHGHTWAAISDPPATATRWPAWGEVTDKPTTFTPSAHRHTQADLDITDVLNITTNGWALSTRYAGETTNRMLIYGSGEHRWAPANGSLDSIFRRVAAGILEATNTQLQASKMKIGLGQVIDNSDLIPLTNKFNTFTDGIAIIGGNTGFFSYSGKVSGDAQWRLIFRASGDINFGSGAAAYDALIRRVAAGVMRVDNYLQVTNDMESMTAGAGVILISPDGLSRMRIRLSNTGTVEVVAV